MLVAPGVLRNEFGQQLLARMKEDGPELFEVDEALLDELSGKDRSNGLMAVGRKGSHKLDDLPRQVKRGYVGIVGAQDPGNVGSILRSIDAFGLDGLLMLDASVDLYHPASLRAGMGAHFWKSVGHSSFAEGVKWANERGLTIIGSSAKEGTPLEIYEGDGKFLLVLGSERGFSGISQEIK